MRIHKEGISWVIGVSLLLVFCGIDAYQVWNTPYQWLGLFLLGVAAVFWLLVLNFFRNPIREIVDIPNGVIAPCDGKIVVVEQTTHDRYFGDTPVIQVSIFMSPLNVHVNRNPIAGLVSFYQYFPGKFYAAYLPKSSTDNEQTLIVYDNGKHEVGCKQIAGLLARRIICYLTTGQAVKQGIEMGFIKFGSRVDLLLPVGSEIKINIGDKAVGGKTLIAMLPA
jgi:phosphatidylserine decarboxylase